ncbi:MAG: hypothetical protein LBL13_04705 [Bacteroidales bacterium]|jgi:hypothetical protein|nr:hypothetical protein [Bacteroidales bacterium]
MRKLRICQEVEDNTPYNGTTRAGHSAYNPLLFQECYIDEQNGIYSSDRTILFAPPVNVKEYVINEKTERIIIPAQKGSILQSLIIKRRAWQ